MARPALRLGTAVVLVLALAFGLNWGRIRDHVRTRRGPPPIRSIVVLPLENLSGDSGQEYFAEGVTDELTTNLAGINSLRVISRTSAMQYAGSHKTIRQIAKELDVDAVVEGSVVRSGSKVRVTAQLIDARRDAHLWAQSYERELGEILNIQDSIALDIASQVKAELSPGEREALLARRSIQPQAYEAYLRGRNELGKQTQQGMKDSVQFFQRAIDLEPLYAPAYSGLADSYSLMANYTVLPPKYAFPRAEAASRKALQLDPSLAEAHASLVFARHHFDWDWAGAELEYERALELSPGYPMAHLRYAEFLSNSGRPEEALREIARAQQLDPLSLTIANNVGRILYHARRYDDAIAKLHELVALNPNRIYAHIYLAMAYEEKQMYPEAVAECKKAIELTGGHPGVGLAYAYARAGNFAAARHILVDLERPDPSGTQDWVFIAGVYSALGDKNRAFDWLERAYDNRDFFLTYLNVLPWMDPLRSDPRFANLVQRIGIPR